MGRFVNPENSAFQVALNSEIYNEEIRSEFAETVARDMEKIHQDYASTIRYNDENYKNSLKRVTTKTRQPFG